MSSSQLRHWLVHRKGPLPNVILHKVNILMPDMWDIWAQMSEWSNQRKHLCLLTLLSQIVPQHCYLVVGLHFTTIYAFPFWCCWLWWITGKDMLVLLLVSIYYLFTRVTKFQLASTPSIVQNVTDMETHMAAYVTCTLYDGCALLLTNCWNCQCHVCLWLSYHTCNTLLGVQHQRFLMRKPLLKANGTLIYKTFKRKALFIWVFSFKACRRQCGNHYFRIFQCSQSVIFVVQYLSLAGNSANTLCWLQSF